MILAPFLQHSDDTYMYTKLDFGSRSVSQDGELDCLHNKICNRTFPKRHPWLDVLTLIITYVRSVIHGFTCGNCLDLQEG